MENITSQRLITWSRRSISKINLSSGTAFFSLVRTEPGGFLGQNAGDSQFLFDGKNMIHAELFKRKSCPDTSGRILVPDDLGIQKANESAFPSDDELAAIMEEDA